MSKLKEHEKYENDFIILLETQRKELNDQSIPDYGIRSSFGAAPRLSLRQLNSEIHKEKETENGGQKTSRYHGRCCFLLLSLVVYVSYEFTNYQPLNQTD